MEAKKLYQRLDNDFELDKCKDDWISKGMDFNELIDNNFKKRHMGLLSDNSEKINFVFTAVFPSNLVLNKILETGKKDALLFTHHPMIWDIRKAPSVFTNINKELLQKLRENRISIYTLHTPLDKNSEYSTSVNLARVLGIKKIGDFCEYFGVMVGVIGTTKLKTIEELSNRLSSAIGHKTKLWNYGSNEIKDQKIALIAGGGNEAESNQEIIDMGINTFVTGITLLNDYSKEAHDVAKSGNLNIIGGTHYSTEKYACMKMCDYFKSLSVQSEFIEDIPILEDIE